MGCSYFPLGFPKHNKKWLCVESLADRNLGAWNEQHWDAGPVSLKPYRTNWEVDATESISGQVMEISMMRPFTPKHGELKKWKVDDSIDFFVGFFYKQKDGKVIKGKSKMKTATLDVSPELLK